MPDERIDAIVDRIVDDARIPGRRRRADLRRELAAHFEDAASQTQSVGETMRRFGDPTPMIEAWRHLYRWNRRLLYAAKLIASLAASIAAATAIEAMANLRVANTTGIWRLAPGFRHTTVLAAAVVLSIITLAEGLQRPFRRSRALFLGASFLVIAAASWFLAHGVSLLLDAALLGIVGYATAHLGTRTTRLLAMFAAFAVAEYLLHAPLRIDFGPMRALAAGAVLVGVCTSTLVITTRVNRMFAAFTAA